VKRWIEPPEVAPSEALRSVAGGHPLVAMTLVRRGLTEAPAARAFLDPAFYAPTPATELPGLTEAVERIEEANRDRQAVCVWGDFDVDGQTATAILVSALRDLGAHEGPDDDAHKGLDYDALVSYHVPVRETESHGVNVPVLRRIIEGGARLILTCDTGIAAHEAADYARNQGVEMVITDHHQPPELLPAARAIVNPKLLGQDHPLYHLPGAGVAYKLAEALYARAPGFGPEAAARHLDLVALGIVADLAVQKGDVRYLLQRGLAALRETRRPGLRLLMESAGLDPEWITEEHISYVLAPRLNAVGRLADANAAVELLTLGQAAGFGGKLSTSELTRARILVDQIETLNARRRVLCDQVFAAAEAQIAGDRELQRAPVLVLSNPNWPAGVIGIVASQLVERYGRPAVLIAAPPGRIARGSARSVEGCNITDAIAAHAGLLTGFGGHPMAAGLSIAVERIPEFSRALSRTVSAMLGAAEITPHLTIDGHLRLDELSPALVDDLARLAPFGPGNPPLTLVSTGLEIVRQRTVGRNEEHRLLTVADTTGAQARVIWWEGAREELPAGRVDLAYSVRASDYRGEREVEIVWIEARPSVLGILAEIAPRRAPIEVRDHRREASPLALLVELRRTGEPAVWREGPAAAEIAGHDRSTLPTADALAVWTAPPGPAELRAVLARVAPTRVYLFGLDPGLDRPESFMRRLAGLARHALSVHGGRTNLLSLAAATAQREATVLVGLEWLAARGDIRIRSGGGAELLLSGIPGAGREPLPEAEIARIRARLDALLEETSAYRAFFRSADADALLDQGG
jgi:single-stranded-DNA-specific exonuclease